MKKYRVPHLKKIVTSKFQYGKINEFLIKNKETDRRYKYTAE